MNYWSEHHQELIYKAIHSSKSRHTRSFAVFDADNTIWKNDITEGLLAWMSVHGHVSIRSLDASILPFPLRPKETLQSYYNYLCSVDHSIGYLFAVQILAGFTLSEIRGFVKEIMLLTSPIQAPIRDGFQSIPVPKVYPAQRELIHTLQAQGVEVWIVSASLEDVVRMIACDSDFGLNLPPERVIGVNLILKSPQKDSFLACPIERRQGCQGLEYFFSDERLGYHLSTIPYAPLSWYGGKVAAILEWIDSVDRPMLVAGDSPNDFYMQFHAAVDDDGIRLRIDTDPNHKILLEEQIRKYEKGTLHESAREGWLEVNSSMLGLPD